MFRDKIDADIEMERLTGIDSSLPPSTEEEDAQAIALWELEAEMMDLATSPSKEVKK